MCTSPVTEQEIIGFQLSRPEIPLVFPTCEQEIQHDAAADVKSPRLDLGTV